MSLIGKATTTTYTIRLDDMKKFIEESLGIAEGTSTIEYVIREVDCDPMDRFPGRPAVTEIKVTVRS